MSQNFHNSNQAAGVRKDGSWLAVMCGDAQEGPFPDAANLAPEAFDMPGSGWIRLAKLPA